LTEWLVHLVEGIPLSLQVLFLATLPVTELRFSIPFAVAMGMPPLEAYALSVLGNILPSIPLLLLLEPVYGLLFKIPAARRPLENFLERTRRKGDSIEKYGVLGLTIFVAIPAPGTGVWTGALLAFLLGITKRNAFFALAAGASTAGVLVTLATVGVVKAISSGYGILLVGVVIVVLIFYKVRKKRD